MPSLLEPAPKRFRTNSCRPLSARHMTEMAVRRGNFHANVSTSTERIHAKDTNGVLRNPFPEENGSKLKHQLEMLLARE